MIRVLRGVAIGVLPVLAGLWVGATEFGGTLLPWHPVMVDLEVYRRAGSRTAGRRRLLRPARTTPVPLSAAGGRSQRAPGPAA